MAGKLDGEVREMNAKLTGLPDTVAKERDRMNKEFSEAHAYLKSLLSGLRTGTADTWDSAKEKVAQAWKRVQTAYDKRADAIALEDEAIRLFEAAIEEGRDATEEKWGREY